jgi:site-specific DNA-adenine methylase
MKPQIYHKNSQKILLPNNAYLDNDLIKSPLNYIGGKYKILAQIFPYFPKNINNFVDLFAGGYNVGINVKANKIYLNDNLTYLIKMYEVFQANTIDKTLRHIDDRIKRFNLSLTNEDGYKKIRELYNEHKNPLDLFVLIAYSLIIKFALTIIIPLITRLAKKEAVSTNQCKQT